MSKTNEFKTYGNWLFEEKTDIIYESRVINEGIGSFLADVGQGTLAFIGALPPLEATGAAETIDAINAGIYFARGEYTNALFSFISVAPVIGDLIGKSGVVTSFFRRMASAGGVSATVAQWIARNAARLLSGLRTLKTWVASNKTVLKLAIRRAVDAFEQARTAREGNVLTEETNSSNEEQEDNVNFGPVQPIYDFIVNHAQAFERYFRNSTVVTSLLRAVDELEKIFEDAIKIIEEATSSSSEEGQEEEYSRVGAVSEITLKEHRLKKLAGLTD